MNISFYGSTELSLQILTSLFDLHKQNKINLKYVISQSSKPFGRGKVIKDNPVVAFAKENNIKLFTPEKLSELFKEENLNELQTDISIVAAYGKIISQKVLNTAKYGFLNFHGSILPKYRGATPVQMTILNQDNENAGITIIKMDKNMDTGDILKRYKFTEEVNNLTAGELMQRLGEICKDAIKNNFEVIFSPERWDLQPQNDENATYCYVDDFMKEKMQILSQETVKEAYGKIMAANPDPIAWIIIKDRKYNLYRAKLVNDEINLSEENSILFTNEIRKNLYLKLTDGIIEILEIQPVGKNKMDARSFINGYLKNL